MSRNHLGKQFEKWSFRNQALTASHSSHQKSLHRVSTRILNIIRKIFVNFHFHDFLVWNLDISKKLVFQNLDFHFSMQCFLFKKSTYPDPPQPSPQSVRRTALYQTAEGMKKLFVDFWKKQFEFRTVFSISFFIQPAAVDQLEIKHNVSTQTNSTEIASKRINFAKFDDFY